ncbi:MAG: RNA pseudouridine synthase [bacterium]|nr:RNA pseudouridine synthase [bacterium]
MKILYEDNHLIAAVKPAGVLSQGDKTGDADMLTEVKKYLKEKYKKPGSAFVGLLHRLDRPVSGIMLFAKTSKGASRLSEQFRNREVDKTYHALVTGKPSAQKGVLQNKLGKDEKLKKAKEYDDGDEARLYYEVIKSGKPFDSAQGGYSLLRITIEGGKFHQIRAQLSLAGLPIVGDVKYLPAGRQARAEWENDLPAQAGKSIALCATGLSFKKATEDEMVDLVIQIPEEWGKYLIHSKGLDLKGK